MCVTNDFIFLQYINNTQGKKLFVCTERHRTQFVFGLDAHEHVVLLYILANMSLRYNGRKKNYQVFIVNYDYSL